MTKTILITGATRGIGRATAELFAAAGYAIIAVARTEADLVAMQEQWLQTFPESTLRVCAADLADPTGRQQLYDRLATWPLPDIVLANAGYFRAGSLLGKPDELDVFLDLNFRSVYLLARQLLPRMIERGGGQWITVGSVATRDDTAGIGQYAVSKYALEGLHRSLAHETRDRGLHFTLIIPGATYTASWADEDFIPERILSADQVARAIEAAVENPDITELVIRP